MTIQELTLSECDGAHGGVQVAEPGQCIRNMESGVKIGGMVGGAIGGLIGAAVGKSPTGAQQGAKLGGALGSATGAGIGSQTSSCGSAYAGTSSNPSAPNYENESDKADSVRH